jgi:hypothetical protein
MFDVTSLTGSMIDISQFDFRQLKEVFIFSKASILALGYTQIPIHWGALLVTSGWSVKLTITPFRAKVRNEWIYTPFPLCAFMVYRRKPLPLKM